MDAFDFFFDIWTNSWEKKTLYQCNIKLMLLMFFTLLLTQFLQSVEAFYGFLSGP